MRVTQQLQLTSEKDSANIPHFGASDVVPAFVCYFLGSFKIAHHSSDKSDATMALLFSCTNVSPRCVKLGIAFLLFCHSLFVIYYYRLPVYWDKIWLPLSDFYDAEWNKVSSKERKHNLSWWSGALPLGGKALLYLHQKKGTFSLILLLILVKYSINITGQKLVINIQWRHLSKPPHLVILLSYKWFAATLLDYFTT